MKTLALSNQSQFLLPKMGILTHLVELTRYDYIYIKDRMKVNDVLSIEIDHGRHWQKNALLLPQFLFDLHLNLHKQYCF